MTVTLVRLSCPNISFQATKQQTGNKATRETPRTKTPPVRESPVRKIGLAMKRSNKRAQDDMDEPGRSAILQQNQSRWQGTISALSITVPLRLLD